MQASSDIFLGWDTVPSKHHYYWRQFHDMQGSADIASMGPKRLRNLGSGDAFDQAVTEFAFTYADQNNRDYAAFIAAIDDGHIEAADG